MSSDVSKVYQFLSTIGDWKTKVDKNGDSVIDKSEMWYFLKDNYFENYSGWDGESLAETKKNDIINQFWKTVDTCQVGKNNGTSNKNTLDKSELEASDTKIQCYEELDNFLQNNIKISDAPSGVSSSKWKNSITKGLTDVVENFWKNKSTEQIKKALEAGELTALLEKQFPISKGKATADYYAMDITSSYKSELGNFDVYTDPVFQELLNKYISAKFPDNADTNLLPSTDEIKADIENFVKAYLATADVGNGNAADLEKSPFEWRQGSGDDLTSLQKNQATLKLNEQINASYETVFQEIFGDINLSASDKAGLKSQLADVLESAEKTFIDSLKYDDWANLDTKLQEFKLNDYVNDEMKNSVLTSYYTNIATEYIAGFDVAGAMSEQTLSTELIASIKTALNGQVPGWVSTFVAEGSASSEFETYLNGKITEFLNSDTVNNLIKAEQDRLIAQNAEKVKTAASDLTNVSDNIKNNNLTEIIGGNASIHTEFGMDQNGNIVFQEQNTTDVYNTLQSKIKTEINKTEAGRQALETLGGENALNSILRAAWIDTYNDYNSSQSNNAAAFISKVLDNFKKIMNKLSTNPEYLTVYTSRTSYADKSLTDNLVHYGTKTTAGGDAIIYYKDDIKTDADGTVHLGKDLDDVDYQSTMSTLLEKLKNKYSSVSTDVVTSVFRSAQKRALEICKGNVFDCPYGTGTGSARVEDTNKDWGQRDNRKKDDFKIEMDELVQITLYCFDKLLYQQLGE